MKQRTITSVYIVLAVALAIAAKFLPVVGNYIFDIFILVLTLVASFEMCNLLEAMGKRINRILVSFYCLFNYIILLIFVNFVNYYYIPLIQLGMLAAYFLIIFFAELSVKNGLAAKVKLKTSLLSLLACFYPGFLFTNYLFINHIDAFAGINHLSVVLILLVIAITFLTDTFAYLVGRTFKGPKIAPKISPKKTYSGCIGGLLGGIIGAMLVFALLNVPSLKIILSTYSLKWWHFMLVGLVVSVIDQIGDLVESKIKRVAAVKDSGNIFPGHGGMLDRIDAMIFVVTSITIFAIIFII